MYLLLRNNKQSGPYSLDELKNMGLKAYDLVWLEGKSAAWRYPGEIPELSVFAPPVEEQPFDRFYKRPSTTAAMVVNDMPGITTTSVNPMSLVNATTPVVPITSVTTSAPVYTVDAPAKIVAKPIEQPIEVQASVPGKRIIYVTMPAGRVEANVLRGEANVPNKDSNVPRGESHVLHGESHVLHGESHVPHGALKEPVHANAVVEYKSAQLPSLEEQLEANSPRHHREQTGGSTRMLRPVVIGACVLALLAAGIFIGLSLNKNSVGPSQKIASTMPVATTPVKNTSPVVNTSMQPAAVTPAGNVHPAVEKPKDSVLASVGQREAVDPPAVKPLRKAAQKKGMNLPAAKDSTAGINPSIKREAVHRADIVATNNVQHGAESSKLDREAARSAVANQVSVGANGYTVGTFGGVNDLQLTVTNRSVYPLDLVVVEVQYIQANKKVYRTENMYFRNVGAGSALMQEAPRSSRGIKVQYKIITISSRELGLSSSAGI